MTTTAATIAVVIAVGCGILYVLRMAWIRRAVERDMPLPPDNYLCWVPSEAEKAAPGSRELDGPLAKAPGKPLDGEAGAEESSSVAVAGSRESAAARLERVGGSQEAWAQILAEKQRLTGAALAGAGLDAILANLGNIHHLLDINWDVLQALDFSYTADLSNFDRLHAIVHEGLNQDPEQTAGWLSRLHGYVAEQVAADALRAQGHHVEFPHASNQPAYDLIVDGHPVQIKDGLDPQAIQEHLQAHPDIHVITSPEMAAQFHGIPEVTGLPELNYDAIHDATIHTVQSVDAIHGGFHGPVITAIISGAREISLLSQNMTDFPTALKNMGLDMLGTGAGAAIGGKLGIALGAPLGPIGAVLGGLIGSIFGAMSGRTLTNEVKLAPLRAAHENLTATVRDAKSTIGQSQEKTRRLLEQAAEEARRSLEEGIAQIREECQHNLQAHKGYMLGRMEAFSDAFPGILEQVRSVLADTRQQVLAQLPRSSFLTRYVWPTSAGLAYRRVDRWFQERLDFVDRAIAEFKALAKDTQVPAPEKIARIRQFVLDHPAVYEGLDSLAAELSAEYDDSLAKSRATLDDGVGRARSLQQKVERDLNAKVRQFYTDLALLVREQSARVHEAWEAVRVEAAKLGKNITLPG